VATSKLKILNRKKTGMKKRTSIGKSRRTSPKSKHKKKDFKIYRGQGK
jgi:hypothetical protein|tara:strand:+ start:684 stop:827 length:144 start_codon:yes stop_codon:yes gene_type:complete